MESATTTVRKNHTGQSSFSAKRQRIDQMKTFKQLFEEKQQLIEGGERYEADEMTMKELKIACYAAQNILDRLEDGAMIQRWQISAIVKASEELASVYTSMSADEEDYDDEYDEYDSPEYGYPSF
jgi:hypothetical protein